MKRSNDVLIFRDTQFWHIPLFSLLNLDFEDGLQSLLSLIIES